MPNKLISGALISVSLLTLLTACGQANMQGSAEQTPKPGQVQSNAPESNQPAKPAEQDNKQIKVKVYLGDENGERLIEQEATISYKQDSEKYTEALKALAKAPEGKQMALLKGITVNSAVLKDQTLTVDISITPEGRLGSGGEALLLQAMKKTVFQFSEIHSLDILVDGEAVESLMGHMDLPHPIKRD